MQAEILYPSQCILAESPFWHPERKCCYWVDIENGVLYEYNWLSKATRSWKFNAKLPLAVQGKDDELILALNAGIAKFNLESEQTKQLLDVEPLSSGNRCNDGASDSEGRLWIGTMSLQHTKGAGALYCVGVDHKVQKKRGYISVSNGIVWSLDNKRMFYIDSPTQMVQSFLFEEEKGNIVFEKNAIEIPADMGSPDGMAIDEEGMLWIAHWGGFGVYRWNPNDGKLLSKIDLPVPQVSSCAFVGDESDYLLITTARENMPPEDVKKYPESGDVFIIKTDVKGTLSNRCLI